MRKILFSICAAITAISIVLLSQTDALGRDRDSKIAKIERHTVEIPRSYDVPYNGIFKAEFPAGFIPGIGSSMTFDNGTSNREYFYTIGDRGPNADSPETLDGKKTKVFLAPEFTPFIAKVRVDSGRTAVLEKALPLKSSGKEISGLPIPPELTGSTKEMPLTERFAQLDYDRNGMDTEGIDRDRQGNFWISDEYGPFIAKVNPNNGEILQKYAPGAGLPEIIKWRQPNRGMEALAVAPNGKIYGVVQSTLDVDKQTKNQARFIRIVELDPRTGRTRMFAYPHEFELYAKSRDAKIGDIAAINNTCFAIVELGKIEDGDRKYHNTVYAIDIAGATDLSGRTLADGKALEYGSARDLETAGIETVAKNTLFDLREYGWKPKKTEGLALTNRNSLAVINDNDFGLEGVVRNGRKEIDMDEVRIKNNRLVDRRGQSIAAQYLVLPLSKQETTSQLWNVQLIRPIDKYCPASR